MVWIAIEDGKVWAAFTIRITRENLTIFSCGGTRLWDWLDQAEEVFSTLAKDVGKSRLHIRGRKAWWRIALRRGWQFVGHDDEGWPMFEKEVV